MPCRPDTAGTLFNAAPEGRHFSRPAHAESVGRIRGQSMPGPAARAKASAGIVHKLSMLVAYRTKPVRTFENPLPTRRQSTMLRFKYPILTTARYSCYQYTTAARKGTSGHQARNDLLAVHQRAAPPTG